MKLATIAGVLAMATVLFGCKSKEQKCLESCASGFTARDQGCSSPTQPNPDRCRQYATEDRWTCRKSCGVDEPNPVAKPTSAQTAAPAATPAPSVPFERDLAKVCAGTPEPMAGAYDGTKGKHNAAVVFAKGGNGDKLVAQTLGDDYKALGVQGSSGGLVKADAYALVVCVDVKESRKAKECPFPTHTLELHDATFQIRVLEARTAKVLADETVNLKHALKSCPSVWNFWSARDVSLPLHAEAVVKVAKKLVDP